MNAGLKDAAECYSCKDSKCAPETVQKEDEVSMRRKGMQYVCEYSQDEAGTCLQAA